MIILDCCNGRHRIGWNCCCRIFDNDTYIVSGAECSTETRRKWSKSALERQKMITTRMLDMYNVLLAASTQRLRKSPNKDR